MAKSKPYFSSAFDNLMEGCQIIGFDWRYLYLNAAAILQSRKTKEELVGKKYTDVWPGSENTELYKIMRRCLDDRVAHRFENEFVYPDGAVGWFDLRIQPIPEGIFILSIDITERKKVEKELRISEEKYRLISENSDDWIYWIDSDGNLQYVSPSCERVTGYSPEEFTNDRQLIRNISFQDDKEIVDNHFSDFLVERSPDDLDFRIVRKTGEVRWISHSCSPIYNQEGKYIGRRGTNRDITERKLAENLLHESEEEFRGLFSNALNGVAVHQIVLDEKGKPIDYIFLKANASFEAQTGLKVADIIGRRVTEVIPGMDKSPLIDIYGKVALSGKPIIFEQYFEPLDRYYHINAYQLVHGRFVTVFQDITERKLAEKSLIASETRMRKLYETGLLGIIYWNMDGKIVDANDKFLEMVGYSRDELEKGQIDWLNMTPPEFRQLDENSVRELKAIGVNSKPFEKEYLRKDGTRMPVLISGAMLDNERYNGVAFVVDNTERKNAEEALRISEEKFRNLFEQSVVGKSMTTLDGKLKINKAFSQILGYTEIELSEFKWQTITHPDDVKKDQAIINSILSGEKDSDRWEKRYIHKNGNIVWVDISTSLQRDNNGEPLFFNTSIIDITERKRAEESLIASESRYRSYIEATGQIGWVTNADGEVVEDIPSFRKFTGQTYAEVEGTGWANSLHPDDLERSLQVWKQAVVSKSFYEIEYRMLRHDGVYRYMLARGFPVFKGDGSIHEWVGACIDITERKFIEEQLIIFSKELEQKVADRTIELQRNKMFLEETGRLARVGGWEIDLITGKNYWTETTKAIHEVEPDFDPNLNTALNFYAPESIPIITACVETLISLGEPFDEELELITAKKNRIWVRAIGQAYRDDGKIVKIGGAIQDINEYKIAEEELATLAKQLEHRSWLLQESNKELEAFSYSVSHDLRAPLRQINGFVDLLNERFYDSLGEKGKHYLDCISNSATQMGTLIDDLLQFSRTGRQEMRHQPLDMEKLVDDVLAQIKPTVEGRLIEWNIAKLPKVYGDYSLLSLVWYNLLDNALKFTSGKEKTIVEAGFTENDDEFQFFVRDNGVGFDMLYAHKLFGVFQRLHSTGEFEGTGIGLANVQRIVLKHGGRVWAEAEPEKGAAFYFTLPKTNQP